MEKLAGQTENVSIENLFESQFAKKERFEVPGGVAEVTQVSPENHKTEVPVFLAPGWGLTAKTYKFAMEDLVKRGRTVITINHPRLGGGSAMDFKPEEAPDKYPAEQLRKALNILGVLEKKEIEKTDVIAHSEGAANAVIAAMLRPEKFRNIVLVAPAGLIGEDAFGRLLKGFAGQMKRPASLGAGKGFSEIPISETEKAVSSAALSDVLRYLAKNPIRGMKEAMEVSEIKIHKMLRYLKEKGIGVVVMATVDDPVFPMDKIQKIAKEDMLDGFLSLRGGHGTAFEHPELYMAAAEQMLTAVEEKRRRISKTAPSAT